MKRSIVIALILCILPMLSFAATIKLLSGDEINADIIEQTDTHLKVNHDVLGELTIAIDKIIAIDAKAITATNIVSVNAVEANNKDKGLFGVGILSNWQRNLTLGLNGTEGNTRIVDFHTAFDGDYENEHKRWDFGAYYNFSSRNGENTQDDLKISITRDWLLPNSQWFYFASAKADWDKFRSWDYRLTGIVGTGYEFIETASFSLIGRTGIAGNKNYGSDNDDFDPELMLGLDTNWAISKIQSLTFKTEFFTPFEQADNFRNLSRLDWKFKLDTDIDLSFKLGLENEYESVVNAATKHNDFRYRAALIWGL